MSSFSFSFSQLITNLLWSIDDSCVVTKLQRADDSGGQGEEEITCYLLFLQWDKKGKNSRRKCQGEEKDKKKKGEIKQEMETNVEIKGAREDTDKERDT